MNYKLLILLVLCFAPVVSAAQTWNLHFSDGTTTINATDICLADGTCLTTSAGGDITAVNTNGPYLFGGGTTGDINLLLNGTLLNLTIDNRAGGDNSSWNEVRADTLYADISVVTDNSSFNQILTNTMYANLNVTGDNSSWNEVRADTLYRTVIWDNFTGIPTATPSNGDTTHLSTADQIYDWVIGLSYTTQSWVSTQLGSYWNTSTDIDTVLSADEIAEANIDFSTACAAGNYYRLNGNDLECTTPGTYNSTYGALVTDNSSWSESYASGLYVNLSGDIMTGNLNMSNNSIIDVSNIDVNKVNATCCVYLGTIQSTDGNSIKVQPTGDEDDFFSFKTPADRPTIKREGGKFIYFESSNVYDVGISFRDDDTYSGTLNYEKDTHKMTLLGKNSSVAIKTNSEYVNYFLFETYNHQPQISIYNGTKLLINDSLEVNGNINSTGYYYGDGSLLTGITHDNSSWNEVRANGLYADIGVTGDNSSWSESYAKTVFNQSWNKTYADTLYADISVVNTDTQDLSYNITTNIISLTDGGSIDISEIDTNTLYSHLSNFTDDIGVSADWDDITDVPIATPSNGDTTHLSTADQIYDWAVGLFLQAMDYTNLALTNTSETFELNVTMNELVFNNSVSHTIRDNSTCIILRGSTSVFEVC